MNTNANEYHTNTGLKVNLSHCDGIWIYGYVLTDVDGWQPAVWLSSDLEPEEDSTHYGSLVPPIVVKHV
jgi:hypothetical protein